MKEKEVIGVLDEATDGIAQLIQNRRLDMESEDKLCQAQQALLSLLCTLQDQVS